MAPEAVMFSVIGALNVVIYLAIFNATIYVGAVKATVIATVVTTTLSYVANRHWTYRNRPRTTLRREYTLFFAFNLAGMLIQAAVVGLAKYGLGFTEHHHRLELNLATNVGIALATVFRFWIYRTMVFRPETTLVVAPAQRGVPAEDEFTQLTAPLEAELAASSSESVPTEEPRTLVAD